MSPQVLCSAAGGKVYNAGMFSQRKALFESVFQGGSECKAMDYHRLGDMGQQAHSVHSGQVLGVKRQSISHAQAMKT